MFGFWHLGRVDWELNDDDLPTTVDSDTGEVCALQSCDKRTGSDVVYFCSYAHQVAWWSERQRRTA